MGWWPWTKFRKSVAAVARTFLLRAKFDSAQTTSDNRRHWANADHLSANAAANPEVRRIVRSRARYEVANNSYARGIVLTLANDVIGTGPRLQMLLGDGADSGLNQTVEREFAAWARAVDLPGKLRTMRMARAQDGEAFAVLFDNAELSSPVQLDLRLIEADQVTTPDRAPGRQAVDGIVFDVAGNPVEYHVLRGHPGDGSGGFGRDYDRVPADSVIHWFRADRPGQRRGLPDILPALPLFAQLRRYTLAVIAAAESAANIAVLMKTSSPAGGEAAEVEPMTEMEFSPNMAVFTPEGWEPSQVKAEQPATTYDMFKREILNEIARCLNMPYNIAACNSSGYNYASGRLDHQTYYKSIRVEQAHCESVVLDRILDAWLAEAVKVYGLGEVEDASHQWFWDGHEHVDPAKEASAQTARLASNTTTLAAEYARQGKDWESELRQRAKEVALMKELGLTVAQPAPSAPEQVKEDDNDEDESKAA
ncbi:MAG: Phage portal protein, lambda family [Planctomycetes bacterium ADurb.Bin126]|nr:MAG: Phage portal protein, lambda family [Planctomycetes bacterium ADurb.Bin126]